MPGIRASVRGDALSGAPQGNLLMTAPGPAPRAPRRARLLFVTGTLVLLAGTLGLCVFSPEPERVAAAGAEATAVSVPALIVAAL